MFSQHQNLYFVLVRRMSRLKLIIFARVTLKILFEKECCGDKGVPKRRRPAESNYFRSHIKGEIPFPVFRHSFFVLKCKSISL